MAVYSPSAKLARSEGVALTESDVEISLPLSRDTLLRLDWKPANPESVYAKPEEVAEFNRRTVIMASSYVFAPHINAVGASEIAQRYQQFSAGVQPLQTMDAGLSVFHKQFFVRSFHEISTLVSANRKGLPGDLFVEIASGFYNRHRPRSSAGVSHADGV